MKNNHNCKSPNVNFWVFFWFIIKISIISFGGGNAVFPIVRVEAVHKHKWITEEQLDEIIIITNALPGASVPEAISYIGITVLGKFKGLLVTFIGLLPHIFIFFGLFILGVEFIPQHYLSIIYVAVMPVIISMLIMLVIRYIKLANKELSYPVFFALFILTVCFNIFIPSPWNIPAFVILFAIFLGIIFELCRRNKTKSARYLIRPPHNNSFDMHQKHNKKLLHRYRFNKRKLYEFLIVFYPTISIHDLNVKYRAKWNKKLGLHLVTCGRYEFYEQVDYV